MRNWTFIILAAVVATSAFALGAYVYTRGEEATFTAQIAIATAGNGAAAGLLAAVSAKGRRMRWVLDWITYSASLAIVYFVTVFFLRTLFYWSAALSFAAGHVASIVALIGAAQRAVREAHRAEDSEKDRLSRETAEQATQDKLDEVLSRLGQRSRRRKRKKR